MNDFNEQILALKYALLMNDEALISSAISSINELELAVEQVSLIRDTLYSHFQESVNDGSYNEALLDSTVVAFNLTHFESVKLLIEATPISFNRKNFKTSELYSFLSKEEPLEFFSESEKTNFFSLLTRVAINLRVPADVKLVLDKLRTATFLHTN